MSVADAGIQGVRLCTRPARESATQLAHCRERNTMEIKIETVSYFSFDLSGYGNDGASDNDLSFGEPIRESERFVTLRESRKIWKMRDCTSLKLFEILCGKMPARQKLSDTPYMHGIRYACCNIMFMARYFTPHAFGER